MRAEALRALLLVAVLVGVLLGFIARDLYVREMGELMTSEVMKLPAASSTWPTRPGR